mmetsp:Transcript_13136/g.29891  ORF Transcript_13136/g.29891 Transcript_13136/m.29891 type:complete len:446 (+) Transcript_13136:70-1407(+)
MGASESRPFSGFAGSYSDDEEESAASKDPAVSPSLPSRPPAGGSRRVRTPRPQLRSRLGSLCARGMPKDGPDVVVVSRYQQVAPQATVLKPHFDEVKAAGAAPVPPPPVLPMSDPPKPPIAQSEVREAGAPRIDSPPASASRAPFQESGRPAPPMPPRFPASCPNVEASPKREAIPRRSISTPETTATSGAAVQLQLHHGALLPPVRQEDTVIIFDWDDTLLCSSAINCGTVPDTAELEAMVKKVLDTAMALGSTLIVTNAHELWVRESSKQYLPGLESTLERMKVISARERHEAHWPGDVIAWKREAFTEVIRSRTAKNLNLVVIGDSLAEICAAAEAVSAFSGQPLVKTVKFMEAPSVHDLHQQLNCILGELSALVRDTKSFSKALSRGVINPGMTPWVKPWGLCDWMAPTGQALRHSLGGFTVTEQPARLGGVEDSANSFTL